jgi:hypothetical protein
MSHQRCSVSSRSATSDSSALIVVPRARARYASRSRVTLSTLIVVVDIPNSILNRDTIIVAIAWTGVLVVASETASPHRVCASGDTVCR